MARPPVQVCQSIGIGSIILEVFPGDDGYGNYLMMQFLKAVALGGDLGALGLALVVTRDRWATRSALGATAVAFLTLALSTWFGALTNAPLNPVPAPMPFVNQVPGSVWPVLFVAESCAFGILWLSKKNASIRGRP